MNSETWANCSYKDADSKTVRTYTRRTAQTTTGQFGGGKTTLSCGYDNDGKGMGYRHILAGHSTDWANKAAYADENWRDLADDSMSAALYDPDTVISRPENDSFGFQILMGLYQGSELVATTQTCTSVTHAVNDFVITSSPANARSKWLGR